MERSFRVALAAFSFVGLRVPRANVSRRPPEKRSTR